MRRACRLGRGVAGWKKKPERRAHRESSALAQRNVAACVRLHAHVPCVTPEGTAGDLKGAADEYAAVRLQRPTRPAQIRYELRVGEDEGSERIILTSFV